MTSAVVPKPIAPVSIAIPEPGPRRGGLIAAFALATLALHLAVLTRYGWFRDELYYMASTWHLEWGYVEHPPLSIALLALVRAAFGPSLIAARLVAAFASVATVTLTGLIARRLGGGGFAQGLACLAALLSPVFLGTGHYYSMNAIDLLLWTVAVWILLGIVRGGRGRDWVGLGVVLGLGLLNKISVLWLGMGLAIGLALTPQRHWLATRWPYLAFAIAALMFAPHLLWQSANGWPTLEFMRNATARKMVTVAPGAFAVRQVFEMGPGDAPVWITGLLFALFAPRGRPWRILGWIYASVAVLLVAGGHSRASYLSVAYPMLLALGGVAWERMLSGARTRALRPALTVLVAALGLAALPFALPVLPVEAFLRYQSALGMAPRTEEHQRVGPLSQQYADMFGWKEMTALVARAYQRLTLEERVHARVFGQNYGEAGAIDVLGRAYGLPRALSGHNSYWLWGPGDWDGRVLIIIGGDRDDNAAVFESIEIVGRVQAPYAMPYERGRDVSIGRRLKMNPAQLWPRLKGYI